MLLGESDLKLEELGLKGARSELKFESFQFLNKSECYKVGKINDFELYSEVEESMVSLEMD
jgi:hypothetical protein